ncbi:hypothetical protein AB0395_29290 [Streptosporangium sp. NPDC051023]|uniref:hypothetical protein n=1 Tax=Streptosporangium sp. NPDC051023 TaxID=3155410 RepID=UPI0034501C9B
MTTMNSPLRWTPLFPAAVLVALMPTTALATPVPNVPDMPPVPVAQAFDGNDRRAVTDAVNHCASAPGTCSFTPEEAYSYTYTGTDTLKQARRRTPPARRRTAPLCGPDPGTGVRTALVAPPKRSFSGRDGIGDLA